MTPNTSQTVAVAYAYPTSTHAQQFGFGRVGCYVVETATGIQPPVGLSGHATLAEAKAAAALLPYPISRYSL